MKKILFDARQELVAFQHQQILKALKDHPGGISPEFFNKFENKGVDLSKPKAVGVAMRDRKSTRLNSSHPSISRMPSSA